MTLFPNSSTTSLAQVGLSLDEIFALGAARGTSNILSNFLATLCLGTLTAMVFFPALAILEIFDLADEVKVSKSGLKRVVGRKLAARVLKSWVDDFVDEDTGELVPIERNEVILERDTIIEKQHIDEIVDSGTETILLHKEDVDI